MMYYNKHIMLCYVMFAAILCYAMLCYAMLCYAMLCYAMLCYAMICYAMLCYATNKRTNNTITSFGGGEYICIVRKPFFYQLSIPIPIYVVPVDKKNDAQNKCNYRPVSLLCNVPKIFERLVYNKMYSFPMENKF